MTQFTQRWFGNLAPQGTIRVKIVSHVVSKLKRPLFVASEMSGFG
jgi:hypothetical protein